MILRLDQDLVRAAIFLIAFCGVIITAFMKGGFAIIGIPLLARVMDPLTS